MDLSQHMCFIVRLFHDLCLGRRVVQLNLNTTGSYQDNSSNYSNNKAHCCVAQVEPRPGPRHG